MAKKDSYEIWEFFEKYEKSNRDLYIQNAINDYLKRNISVLSDGIISQIPILSGKTRNEVSKHYCIPPKYFDDLKKRNKELKIFRREESINDLRLGLIISYAKTGKAIFLNYLALLTYSSLYFKYFRNGKNDAVLKYTIETQDDRTDFKKYQMSLNIVISKKIEVFEEFISSKHYIDSDGRVNDANIVAIYQSLFTRFNNMLRTICSKYMENMKDDNIKIMMQYSKTLDGKNVISPLNVIETVRDRAIDDLRIPSFTALNMSGLNMPSAKLHKDFFLMYYSDNYEKLVSINNLIINEWLKRNQNETDISVFKNKFVSVMSTARNLDEINNSIDSIYEDNITEDIRPKISKTNFRKYIYKYLLAVIVLSTKAIFEHR